ncbi:uncharacterized protein LOC123873906 [Maniola jurtina]|uniref:uncharacterized protein LOC123873906 n=1 Tax=Maniola jurtina TaxID=191418 RepID=UPI001E689F8C|nr:uncharacterized protein LOC123873906 [Maniola jurtina]
MHFTCNWKTVLLRKVCVIILNRIGIAAKIIQLVRPNKQSDTINEILLYGAGDYDRKKQLGLNNLFCVYNVLVHARQTIDVCMPSLDSETISKCLINVHEKSKVKLRIVVHKNFDLDSNHFLDYGIEVKVISQAEVRLEHEFMLIDAVDFAEGLAIIGSLDYELKRVNCDSDSTLMTSEKAVVSTLKREFDRIWNSVAETNTHYTKTLLKNI